mmetsp:Transcript_6015/g.12219  ORF Transcript_6015/g.12219 Transcript_6015/m.12219 type:complete len:593 (-) Transcript_6015:229-2007(-)
MRASPMRLRQSSGAPARAPELRKDVAAAQASSKAPLCPWFPAAGKRAPRLLLEPKAMLRSSRRWTIAKCTSTRPAESSALSRSKALAKAAKTSVHREAAGAAGPPPTSPPPPRRMVSCRASLQNSATTAASAAAATIAAKSGTTASGVIGNFNSSVLFLCVRRLSWLKARPKRSRAPVAGVAGGTARPRAARRYQRSTAFNVAMSTVSARSVAAACDRQASVCTVTARNTATETPAFPVGANCRDSHWCTTSSQLRDSHSLSRRCSRAAAVARQPTGACAANSATPASKRSKSGQASKRSHWATSATSSARGSPFWSQRSRFRSVRARYSPRTPSTASTRAACSGCGTAESIASANSGPDATSPRRCMAPRTLFSCALLLCAPCAEGAPNASQSPRNTSPKPSRMRPVAAPPALMPGLSLAGAVGAGSQASNFLSSSSESTSSRSVMMGDAHNSDGGAKRTLRAVPPAGALSWPAPVLAEAALPNFGVVGSSKALGGADKDESTVEELEPEPSSSLQAPSPSSGGPPSSGPAKRRAVSRRRSQRRVASGLSARKRQTRKPKSSSISLGWHGAAVMRRARRTSKDRFAAPPGC